MPRRWAMRHDSYAIGVLPDIEVEQILAGIDAPVAIAFAYRNPIAVGINSQSRQWHMIRQATS